VPTPAHISRTAWYSDPFAYGAYSNIGVGASAADIKALAEPVEGRLFFAGEATNNYHWGCVHSAYDSGLREAARISGDASIYHPPTAETTRRQRRDIDRLKRFTQMRLDAVSTREIEVRVECLRDSVNEYGVTLFDTLMDVELHAVASMLDEVQYQAGEEICREDEPTTSLYLIKSGEVAVKFGGIYSDTIVARGCLLGSKDFFFNGRTLSLTAVTDVELYCLDNYRYKTFLYAFPDVLMAMITDLVTRWEQLEKIIPGEVKQLGAEAAS
jgi:hypothetical protein